jgi:hypothetical protein
MRSSHYRWLYALAEGGNETGMDFEPVFARHANRTSQAAMSGGLAVTGRKMPELVRAGPRTLDQGTTRTGFFRTKGLALTAWGPQGPN